MSYFGPAHRHGRGSLGRIHELGIHLGSQIIIGSKVDFYLDAKSMYLVQDHLVALP